MLYFRRGGSSSGGLAPDPTIDGITGTANPLDAVLTATGATADKAARLLSITVGGVIQGQLWQYLAGNNTASNGLTAQRAQDYNAVTNIGCWIRLI